MILYTLLGFSILATVFFIVRAQSMQSQLRQLQYFNQKTDKHKREVLTQLSETASETERLYLEKLESAYEAGLINAEKYDKSRVILSHYSFVIFQCLDKQLSVQAAMKKVADKSQTPLQEIQQFIALQPGKVRTAWSSNQLTGFTQVCMMLATVEERTMANAS